MKNKLQVCVVAAILLFITSITVATAQTNNGNIPETLDPATGLPVASPVQWIDPSWGDTGYSMSEINFTGLPLPEIARQLKENFTNHFDIIFPDLNKSLSGMPEFDFRSITVTLQLKTVTATEVFNAMNLQFEAGNVPVRWKLFMNGHRPTVLLSVLSQDMPPAQQIKRMVFFVGDILRLDNSSNVVDTIAHVWDSGGLSQTHIVTSHNQDTVCANYSNDSTGQVQIYLPAQLLIVSGTSAQIELAQQTLQALKQKLAFASSSPANTAGIK
ncbi:MAG TPA: hypothetical protein VGO57_17920 [Verrucomicrobiae bacterium]|jgi:hypothetical protein